MIIPIVKCGANFPMCMCSYKHQRVRKHGGCAFSIWHFYTRQKMGVIVNACGGSAYGGLGDSVKTRFKAFCDEFFRKFACDLGFAGTRFSWIFAPGGRLSYEAYNVNYLLSKSKVPKM